MANSLHQHDFKLPTGKAIRLLHSVYLGGSVANYINGIRRGWIKEDSETGHEFRRLEPQMCADITQGMKELGLEFDALVRVPSSRGDSDVLHGACLAKWPEAADLSPRLSRAGKFKAADAASVADMVAELIYRRSGNESEIRTLLIVDESISTGKTVAAVLEILQANGVPADVEVTLAVYVVMKMSTD